MTSFYNPQNLTKNTEGKIVYAVDRIAEALKSRIWSRYSQFKLSPIQIRFIIFLMSSSRERKTVSRIASEFNLTKATVSDAVSSLEKKGLISRKKEQGDRRVVLLSLTKKGETTARKVSGYASEVVNTLRDIPENEKTVVLQTLMQILEKLHENGLVSSPRMCITCGHLIEQPQKNRYSCKKRRRLLNPAEFMIDCNSHKAKHDNLK
jgi:DNA-binding MarR family transcriptional regulator